MKILLCVLLVLALGAAALFLTLESSGRGERSPSPRTPAEDAGTRSRASPELTDAAEPVEQAPTPAPEIDDAAAPQRQAMRTEGRTASKSIFEGTIVADGAPLPNADVQIVRQELLSSNALSDARGRFHIQTDSITAPSVLRVGARGFVTTERRLEVKPAGGTFLLGNLRLVRGQRLTGRVIDGRGIGVGDAELRVEPLGAGTDLLVATAHSQIDGLFEVPDAPPGIVLVNVRAKGFGETTVQHAKGAEPFEIQLEPGVELRLLLSSPRGEPIVGAEVSIQAQNAPRAAKRVQISDAEGRVRFEGLGSRQWSVRISHADYRPTNPGTVQANDSEQRIECLPWPAIAGVVRAPDGAPPPRGTKVQALPASTPGDRIADVDGGVAIAPDGSFRIPGLRAGEWRVRVTAPGFAPATSATVRLGIEGDGFAGTIDLESGNALALALVLDGTPVAGAEVELFQLPPTPAQLWALASSRTGLSRRLRSGADGRLRFDNLPRGNVWVAVYADGCPPTTKGPFGVGPGTGEAAPIELVRGGRVKGVVSTADGASLVRAQLRIVDTTGRLGFPLTLVSDERGRYTSEWLPPGRYTVEAFTPEDPTRRAGPTEFEVRAGEERDLGLTL